MKPHISPAVALLVLTACCVAGARTWTDRTGKVHIEADFADFDDGKVILRLPGGDTVAIAIEQFSKADQEFVRAEMERRRAVVRARTVVSDKPGTVAYAPGREICKLACDLIDESSGLACSRNRPGLFWTHNDSGDDARIFAFDRKGKDLGFCRLIDVLAFDWEDMASFTLDGKNYLLLADVGNNGRAAAVHMLHLIEEPPVEPIRGVAVAKVPLVQTMYFSYEDDHRNCEAVAVDPTSKTILLVSKEEGPRCYVYALPWPKDKLPKAVPARKIATLKIPKTTAMDVSPDGRRAVVLSYENAYEYTRRDKEDWAAAFSRPPAEIAIPRRRKGESICFGPDGNTLYLTSEKRPTPLWEVPVVQAVSTSLPVASDGANAATD